MTKNEQSNRFDIYNKKKFVRIQFIFQIKFTHLIPKNICVQDESMMKFMYTLVLIQHCVLRVERIL